jgi:ribose 5-phosphate isomerase A
VGKKHHRSGGLGESVNIEALKEQAGIEACRFVKTGMAVGLGTGSTVKYTILELGRRVRDEGLDIVGVPTSVATATLAEGQGITLVALDDVDGLDVVIDGTDEFDPSFHLIKGGGAALLREKIVAQASKRMVVVADSKKEVDTLGAFPLPIEVTPFASGTTVRALAELLGCTVTVRQNDGQDVVTDNGNLIVDAHTGPTLNDPVAVEQAILSIAGVVQVGLFTDMCDVVVMASPDGVATLIKPS